MRSELLDTFDASLERCLAAGGFLDRFYDIFLASSPKVKEKFANTDFARQKMALKASFYLILAAARDEQRGPERFLRHLAEVHSAKQLDIGAELYDLWLDSLLDAVREHDPEAGPEVIEAWEEVSSVGIRYLCAHYND